MPLARCKRVSSRTSCRESLEISAALDADSFAEHSSCGVYRCQSESLAGRATPHVAGDRGWWITIVISMAITKESNPGVKNYITPGGLQRLRDELRFLLTKERPAVTQVVAWAASR